MVISLVTPFASDREDGWIHVPLALLLLGICLYPTWRYLALGEKGLPIAAVFGAVYGFQFAVPVFLREPIIELVTGQSYLHSDDVTAALVMAIAGITALLFGYYRFQASHLRGMVPIASLPLDKRKAALYCALISISVPFLAIAQESIPEDYRGAFSAILRVLQLQVLVVVGLLGWLVYAQRSSRIYTVWLFGLVGVEFARGVVSGGLEQAIVPFVIVFVVRWLHTGKVSVAPIGLILLLALFLSPVKTEVRQQTWYGLEMSRIEKGVYWVDKAADYWIDTLVGNRPLKEATAGLAGRSDLVHQVAHIHELTPESIPFQYGATYSYFAVAFVPRVLWPTKPEVGTANTFFAVNYGITTEEGAQRSTFGVSLLGEAYLNFGWLGVVGIMMLYGLVLGVLQRAFGGPASGAGGQAIFLAFFVFFLNGMGSSAEVLFGNIVQNILAGYLLLLWARQRRPPPRFAGSVALR